MDDFILCPNPLSIAKSITPTVDSPTYITKIVRIAVIGGSFVAAGTSYFAASSALKLGIFAAHVFCMTEAAFVIKGYHPEIVLHPILRHSRDTRDEDKAPLQAKIIDYACELIRQFDCLVIGPGLDKDKFLLDCVSEIMKVAKEAKIPMVVNGRGLHVLKNCIDLVKDYPLAVLIPGDGEYERLVQKVLDPDVDKQDGAKELLSLSKGLGGVTILRRGPTDLISDGEKVFPVNILGPPRKFFGQVDILSGSIAVFLAWARKGPSEEQLTMKPTVSGCIAASTLVRRAALLAFQEKKRSTLTSDIIHYLGISLENICPLRPAADNTSMESLRSFSALSVQT